MIKFGAISLFVYISLLLVLFFIAGSVALGTDDAQQITGYAFQRAQCLSDDQWMFVYFVIVIAYFIFTLALWLVVNSGGGAAEYRGEYGQPEYRPIDSYPRHKHGDPPQYFPLER